MNFFQYYAGICACFEGGAALDHDSSPFFILPFSFPNHWVIGGHAGAAVANYLISIMAYGTGIMGAYVLAENRLALPAGEVARLSGVEVSRSTLFIIAGIFLLAALFPSHGHSPHTSWWIVAGLAAAISAFLLNKHYSARIKAWRKGWETSAPEPSGNPPD